MLTALGSPVATTCTVKRELQHLPTERRGLFGPGPDGIGIECRMVIVSVPIRISLTNNLSICWRSAGQNCVRPDGLVSMSLWQPARRGAGATRKMEKRRRTYSVNVEKYNHPAELSVFTVDRAVTRCCAPARVRYLLLPHMVWRLAPPTD
jgi:hypothetical protein